MDFEKHVKGMYKTKASEATSEQINDLYDDQPSSSVASATVTHSQSGKLC